MQTPLMSPPTLTPRSDAPSSPTDTPDRRVRWREVLGAAAFEASFVVLGVVLAFAANEWREARLHRAEGASARTAIVNELRANRQLLDSSRAYHSRLLGGIYGTPPNTPLAPAFFSGGFIKAAPIATTAWEVAGETGALSHIPYADVLAISQVVAMERRYDAMAVSTGQLIYGEMYRAGPAGIAANARNLGGIIGAFMFREAELVKRIDSTLKLVDSGPR